MIWYKCLHKIRNEHGVITKYQLVDANGNVEVVDKEKLKLAIANTNASITNLKLTRDGSKLMDRGVAEATKLEAQMCALRNPHSKDTSYMKARMLGVAPDCDDKGNLIGWPSSETVILTSSIKQVYYLGDLKKTVIFSGSSPIEFVGSFRCAKAIIQNPTMVPFALSRYLSTQTLILNYDGMNVSVFESIFNMFKSVCAVYNNKFEEVIVERSRLDCKEAYDKVIWILKRQNISRKLGRRCFDIMAYLRLIYTAYISFGDKSILEWSVHFIDEYNRKIIELHNEGIDIYSHDAYVTEHRVNTRELINKINEEMV